MQTKSLRLWIPANMNMRTIKNGYKHSETLPLPVWHDESKVLQYDSHWADELVCSAYGDDRDKYELNNSTLELYYLVSDKMRFKVAAVEYESYYTDIKGRDWEEEWLETWKDMDDSSPEEYEMYNITVYHYNHPSLKSNLILSGGKLKGVNGEEYVKGLMERIQREEADEEDDDDIYYK